MALLLLQNMTSVSFRVPPEFEADYDEFLELCKKEGLSITGQILIGIRMRRRFLEERLKDDQEETFLERLVAENSPEYSLGATEPCNATLA